MRIVVTGATGFVGAHLVRHLQLAGHDLLLVSRTPGPDGERLRWLKGDFGYPEAFIAEVADFAPEAVFHVAWEGIPDFSETASVRNVVGSLRFLGAVGHLPSVRKVVAAGSCWEYAPVTGPVAEDATTVPTNWFTWAKTTVFQYLVRLAEGRGINWYWPRIFFVYGKGQRPQSLIPSVVSSLRASATPDVRSPFATNDFIYVEDVAAGLASCLEDDIPSGIYNLGSGGDTKVLDVVREIEALLGQGERATSAITTSASQTPKPGIIADITRSRRVLHWEARTSLRRGLELYLGGDR